ncbi:MAG: hypothetical protein NT142_03075 [Planctomycetota bacterium]|nr:hypothetical protein [Planctomycetota bacterium]
MQGFISRKRTAPWTIVTAMLLGGWNGGVAFGADVEQKPVPVGQAGFGMLAEQPHDALKKQVREYLTSRGLWKPSAEPLIDQCFARDLPLSDKFADALALGDAGLEVMLLEARNKESLPPAGVPAFFKDPKYPDFVRANVGVSFARALSLRRIHEEALETLGLFAVEKVADPGTYLYHRAVSEHALMMKNEATTSIDRLLQDVPNLPERYRMLGMLLYYDLTTWKEKDLSWISRKMEMIQRRLEVTRGGKTTQKIQKEVVARLDEMIKELENQQKESSSSNQGNCPDGAPSQGQPGNNPQPTEPAKDSRPGGVSGQGVVDSKRVKELASVWGKLPEKERVKALVELTRNAPTKYREAIELYFKKLSQTAPAPAVSGP